MRNTTHKVIKAYDIDMKTNLIGNTTGHLHPAHQATLFLFIQTKYLNIKYDNLHLHEFTFPGDSDCYLREKNEFLSMNTPLQLIN